MERFFLKIYDFFSSKRFPALLLPILAIILFFFLSIRLSPNSDIESFLPYQHSKKNSPGGVGQMYKLLRQQDRVMILFRGDDYIKLEDAADEFIARFENSNIDGIKDPIFTISTDQFFQSWQFVVENMPYFLTDEDYDYIDSIVSNVNPLQVLTNNRERLLSPSGDFQQDIIAIDPFNLSGSLTKRLLANNFTNNYIILDQYLFSKDTSTLIMSFATQYGGSEVSSNSVILSQIDSISNIITSENADIKISTIGSAVIARENERQINKDSFTAAIISLILISLILLWYFKRIAPLLLILIPVGFGILLSLAFFALYKPNISLLALTGFSVILGIGVDYALMYLSVRKGVANSKEALRNVVSPMIIGNITTVGAFLSLLVMSSEGMRDFGLLAAIALVGSILFVLLFLPQLTNKFEQNSNEKIFSRFIRFDKIKYIGLIIFLLTIVFYFFGKRVGFDGDFNSINYNTEQQKKDISFITSLNQSEQSTTAYFVTESNDIDDALIEHQNIILWLDSLSKCGVLLSKSSVSDFFPTNKTQQDRIQKWNNFREENGNELKGYILRYSSQAGFSPTAFEPFIELLSTEYQPKSIDEFQPLLNSSNSFYINFDSPRVTSLLTFRSDSIESISAFINQKIDGTNSYVFDSQSTTNDMIATLNKDFNRVLAICSILVFVFLCIAFRRIELAIIAFIPMVVSWIWITGLMGLLGINFNILSVILSTFIFGLGDDYTIYMVEGLEREWRDKKPILDSFRSGVTLSALTLFAGVATLIFAKHPALHNLGIVAIVGMVCVFVMSLILPNLLFKLMTQVRYKGNLYNRIKPLTIREILNTIYCSTVFLCSCIYYKIITPFFKSSKNYRERLQKTMFFFTQKMPMVNISIDDAPHLSSYDISTLTSSSVSNIDSIKKLRDNPAVIISNHQSHLDLMLYLAIIPDVAIVTNKWVYHSPVYSDIIKKAEFISLEDGIEDSIPKLSKAISQGRSILIFPEGTRSEDCLILPFKSGAFHIASMLNLDIQPVLLTGAGEIFPKREFVLRKGDVSIRFMERIPISQLKSYGVRGIKQAKSIELLFKQEYSKMTNNRVM